MILLRQEYKDIVKIKRILVHNHISTISENKIKKFIKQAGLTQKIIWGDCYKKCKHNSKDFDFLEIQLGFTIYSPFWAFLWMVKDKIDIFIRKDKAKISEGLTHGFCSYFTIKDRKDKQPMIRFNFHYCICKNFLSLLKHELLHVKYEGHCVNEDCLFSDSEHQTFEEEQKRFCRDCQRKYDKMIKEMKIDERGYKNGKQN